MSSFDTEVIISGGGPVGMTLALELASHGVRSILLERNATTTRHPKMDLTNGRSMELFRKLGISEDLRAVGVSADAPLDIVWASHATGKVLCRFAYPTPNASRELARVSNDGTGTREPSMRVSQIILEPVLKKHVDASDLIDVRFGWEFTGLSQDSEGVTAIIREGASGKEDQVRALYLAGCDGGGSRVRESVGIPLQGEFGIADAFMVHFHSTDYDALAKFGIAYHLQTGSGTLIAQDGKEIWTLQAIAPADSDPDELMRQFAGRDFDYEILVANPWKPHMVLAERYREGRVMIAGDAAHQFIPTGGYGMNTGIGDAVGLGWMLSAIVRGWGGPDLLDAYEAERRKVAARNLQEAGKHAQVRSEISAAILDAQSKCDIEADENAEQRSSLSRYIAKAGNAENESWGIEHGYSYHSSPVIFPDGSEPPDFDPLRAPPSTVPGSRLPSLYLQEGEALYDLLGRGFTLIAINRVDVTDVEEAAGRLPFEVLRLEGEPVLDLLQAKLLLVRPDHHVAWRGDVAPAQWSQIFSHVLGHAKE